MLNIRHDDSGNEVTEAMGKEDAENLYKQAGFSCLFYGQKLNQVDYNYENEKITIKYMAFVGDSIPINLAKKYNLNYTVDIFPYYSSDIGVASRAGIDFKGALFGTGVSASHGMERTHLEGIESTLKLTYLYFVGE